MGESTEREQHTMQVSHQDIAARAYQLWEEEGRPHGRDLDHWSKAASELDSTARSTGTPDVSAAPTPRPKAAKASTGAAPAVPSKAKRPARTKK